MHYALPIILLNGDLYVTHSLLFLIIIASTHAQLMAKLDHSFSIQKGRQLFFYAGTVHHHNPNNPQYDALEKEWTAFLQKTDPAKRTLIIECSSTPNFSTSKNPRDAIAQEADKGFARELGLKSGVTVKGADLSYREQVALLLKKYPKEKVYYWNFAILTEIWNRLPTKPNFETWLMPYLKEQTQDKTITLAQMIDLHEKFFRKPFNKEDGDFFYSITYPQKTTSEFNQFSKYIREQREAHMGTVMQKEWNNGNSVFVVIGSLHARNQEKGLRQALT